MTFNLLLRRRYGTKNRRFAARPPLPHRAARCPMNDPQSASRRITLWLIALVLTAAFCAAPYAWFDRPIAFFMRGSTLSAISTMSKA